jgi:hypothetical protein
MKNKKLLIPVLSGVTPDRGVNVTETFRSPQWKAEAFRYTSGKNF